MFWRGPKQCYEASKLRPSYHLVACPSQSESSLSGSVCRVLRSGNAQQSRRQVVAVEAQRSRRCLKSVDLLRAQHLQDDNRVTLWVPFPTARRCILHGARDCNVFTPLGAVTPSDHSLKVFLLDGQEYCFVCDYPVHNRRFMPLFTLVRGGTSSDDTASSDYTRDTASSDYPSGDTASSDYTTAGARRLCRPFPGASKCPAASGLSRL